MLKKIRTNITGRNRVLRSRWYPESKKDDRHADVLKALHESYSKVINKTMLSLLGVGLYILLAVLGSSDKLLIATNSAIQTPLVGTSISFIGFLIVSPFLLIILTVYLHIFYGKWLLLEKKREELNKEAAKTGEPTIESVPTIFSFRDPLPRFVTSFIFYWFVPVILCFMAYKAFALKELILPMFYVVSSVTFALLVLQIKRYFETTFVVRSILLTHVLFVMFMGVIGYFTDVADSFRRPLNLQQEDLHDAWLQGFDLTGADMSNANLKGANLRGASLRKAHLNEANFQGANLGGADFTKADLFSANFREVTVMNLDLIKTAEHWQQAFYSSEHLATLKLPPTHNEELEKVIKIVKIGDCYEGGKIAYMFQPGDKGYVEGEGHGLIAAEADLSGGDSFYTWEAAKKACDDLNEHGYSDWYLPSKKELNQLYINRGAVGGFSNYIGYYWSSTEYSAEHAWRQAFDYGSEGIQNYGEKTVGWWVRPVRAF